LRRALAYGTPLLLGTLGEIYSERAGVLNLGVEGMMILGAFTGFVTTYTTGNPLLGILVAAVVGGAASMIHGFFSISIKTKIQVVSGLALTFFGLGLTGVIGRGWEGKPLPVGLPKVNLPLLDSIPILGPILSGQNVLVYIGIGLAVILWFILFKTTWGVTIRSVGEDPAAADTLGVNVVLVRYLCVLLGGVLAGIAGAYLSIDYRPSWTEGMTVGMGWIVIALTIFAFWNPTIALIGAYIFGSLFSLAYKLQPFLAPELLMIMPYLFTIIALVVINSSKYFRRRLGVPTALGIPYDREEK
jgi:simple sugar transport system permease protein